MISHHISRGRTYQLVAATLTVLFVCSLFVGAKPSMGQDRGRGGKRGPQAGTFHTEVPAHAFDVILSRPTTRSVIASVLAYQDLDAYLEYGPTSGAFPLHTATFHLAKGEPREIAVEPLTPDTPYSYRLRHRPPASAEFAAGPAWTFHTARPLGATFTFAIQADSHLDENTSPETYSATLANVLAGQPDFYIDLGDTFMTDKRRDDFSQALPQYLAQRHYFGLLCHSAPLFMALGNHDGENSVRPGGMAAWAGKERRRYFPNPRPDGFYSGNPAPLEDYYSWEWGDALFIVLDPYAYSTAAGETGGDWSLTLGRAQYDWLQRTLEHSSAAFKFVFTHNLIGGKDMDGKMRGGVEVARYLEWGGLNLDNSPGFAHARPGWPMPIHQLLVANHVTAVFHGHDHLYARQELDGILYQEVPQPGAVNPGVGRRAADYDYTHGTVLDGSGHIRVTVSPSQVRTEFVRTWTPGAESGDRQNREVADSFTILPASTRGGRGGENPPPGEGRGGRGRGFDIPPPGEGRGRRRDGAPPPPDEGGSNARLRAGGGRRPGPQRIRVEPLTNGVKGNFTAHGNGTITDSATGLVWQQSDGGEMAWQKASAYCRELSLGGFHDWRLPTTAESFSILDHAFPNPALDLTVFPSAEAEYWWTSETRADDASRVWVTNAGGGAGPHPATESLSAGGAKRYHVRCARNSTPAAPLLAKFVAHPDGTVTDHRNGLIWQQTEAGAMTWNEALQFAKELSLSGHHDWRLPTIKELQSLNDPSVVTPSLDRTAFPQASPSEFWSATSLVNRPERAWTADFRFGIVSYKDKAEKLRVRAVRGGN